jgi:hypothetical protein
MASRLFDFPNPVNEKAARTVAAGVVVQSLVVVGFSRSWLFALLAAGFVARVLSGPRFSPLGQLATRVVAPRLGEPKLVSGPPKRFAQGIGATLSTAALVSHLAGWTTPAVVLVALIVAAAVLESAFAICLGCMIFAALMRAGIIPSSVCEACNDISARLASPAGPARSATVGASS